MEIDQDKCKKFIDDEENYSVEAGTLSASDTSNDLLCDLRLVDYTNSPTAKDAGKQQLMPFEIRCGNEVLSQAHTAIEAWERCANFLHNNWR